MGSMDKECWKPEKHPVHMCKLLKQGQMEELDRRSAKPTVRCAKCGVKADRDESVCQPLKL